MRMAGKFRNSYEWIEAFKAHFAEPAVAAALAVPLEVRMRHGALKNLLAGTTCVAHHDPWHAVCDEPGFPVAVLREYRSEKYTFELKSLMRISYAVFCLKKKNHTNNTERNML